MKELVLMRHAKASRDNPELADIDRPITSRGEKDASEMAKRLALQSFVPDLILSSVAKRAHETAKGIAPHLNYKKEIELSVDMYHADTHDLLHVLRTINDTCSNVILVGHNPTFTAMAGFMGQTLIDHLPTSGMVLLKLNILSWKQAAPKCGTLTWFDSPKHA